MEQVKQARVAQSSPAQAPVAETQVLRPVPKVVQARRRLRQRLQEAEQMPVEWAEACRRKAVPRQNQKARQAPTLRARIAAQSQPLAGRLPEEACQIVSHAPSCRLLLD